MKENQVKYVVTWFLMYRCIDFPTKFSSLIFSEIIIMKNMNIRISILQTTDFDETLSGLQSTHSKHILFSDDRNLTDRFFIHLTWRFSIILISKLLWSDQLPQILHPPKKVDPKRLYCSVERQWSGKSAGYIQPVG